MVAFAELDIVARTDSLKKAKVDLDALTKSATRTEDAAQDAGVAVSNAGGKMAFAGGNARMLTQQLSQVAQQGAATGQWMQAMTIQAADIGLAFGTVGTVIGALATIAIPSIIAGFSAGGESAKTLDRAIDDLNQTIADASRYSSIAVGDFDELRNAYGDMTSEILTLVDAQSKIDLRTLSDQADGLTASLVAMYDGNAWFNVGRAEDLGNALRLGTQNTNDLVAAIKNLQGAGNLDQQIEAATALQKKFLEMAGPVGQMTKSQFEYYTSIVQSEAALRRTKSRADEMAASSENANAAIAKMSPLIQGAIGYANQLAGAAGNVASQFWSAAEAAASAAKIAEFNRSSQDASMVYGKVGARGDPRTANQQGSRFVYTGPALDANNNVIISGTAGGGGGGGGGRGGSGMSDGFADKLDALTKQFESERELVDAWYEESQAVLDDRRAMEILGAEEHARVLLSVEEELQRRKAEIRDQDLSHYESFFGAMAGAMQSGGDRMLKISKGFALAEAAVSIWRGAAKALELPFPASLAAWGQVISTGAKALSGIKSASFGGGSVGGGGSSGGSREATSAPAQQERIVRLDVRGEGMFADMLRESGAAIVDAITNEGKYGGTTVVVGR